jgi:hypothetical protein
MPLDLDLQVRGCRSGALAGPSKTVCPATRIAASGSKMTGRSPRNVIVVSRNGRHSPRITTARRSYLGADQSHAPTPFGRDLT